MTELMSISPLDGRYAPTLTALSRIGSEYGFFYYRVVVELGWFQLLAAHPEIPECPPLSDDEQRVIQQLMEGFTETEAAKIKTLELQSNHDVKAVEYYLKNAFSAHPSLKARAEFLHFACTSEDINNLAYGLMIKDIREQLLRPALQTVSDRLLVLTKQHAGLALLARTHGQAATPTTLGKELANVLARLHRQTLHFYQQPLFGKFNGAVGNYNAHVIAYPEIDWLACSEQFVTSLGLVWNPYTTQIEPHDFIAEVAHNLSRINTILIDFAQDVWHYISLGYFKQMTKPNEVGSSTMPHKVNPIDFENAEGNLGVANALLLHFANKLPISRWQRDLSDSTVLRNLAVAFGHTLVAYHSLEKGLNKLAVDEQQITADLNEHWEVLAEAVQTVMRRYGSAAPYESLKTFTRGKQLDEQSMRQFIDSQNFPETIKKQLLALQPESYTGEAKRLALRCVTEIEAAKT